MKLTKKLLQEFKERMALVYKDVAPKDNIKPEDMRYPAIFFSAEAYFNALQQFMLEKTLEKQVTGSLCNIESAICYIANMIKLKYNLRSTWDCICGEANKIPEEQPCPSCQRCEGEC